MSIRKKYSKKFKLDAINLVLEQGYSQADAAKGYYAVLLQAEFLTRSDNKAISV